MNKMTRSSLFSVALLCVILGNTTVSHAQNTITFDRFPGVDNTLGTGDDVFPAPTSVNSVHFTNQFSRLVGSAGFVVDSIGITGGTGLGAVGVIGGTGRYLLRARPDANPTAYSFSSVRIRFVNPADGVTPVSLPSFGLDLVPNVSPGATNTVRFFDAGGALLNTVAWVDGQPGNVINYANASGIASVETSTSFSLAHDNLRLPATFITGGASAPEPGTLSLLALGAVGTGVVRRRKQAV